MANIKFLQEKLAELPNLNGTDLEIWYNSVASQLPQDGIIQKEFRKFAAVHIMGEEDDDWGNFEGNKAKAKKLLEDHIKVLSYESENPSKQTFGVGGNIINSNVQVNTSNSSQTLNLQTQKEDILQFLNLLKTAIKNENVPQTLREDLETEINYAEKHLQRGNNIDNTLINIGSSIKNVGANVIANLIASPIFEVMKPLLGL